MKKIYLLEVNCDFVGAYETKEKAMVEGLLRYTNWLDTVVSDDVNKFTQIQIVQDLQDFINHNYIEDYIYITEVPYYGSDNNED